MNKQLEQAIATATRHLSDEGQNQLASFILTEAKRLSILQGIADADAGRLIPHEDVKAWAESLGTENELPPPHPKKSGEQS